MARFSLKCLLASVGLTAFFFAALCNPSDRWKVASQTMVLLLLTYGAIRACVPNSKQRVFWSAFVVTSLLWAIVAPMLTQYAFPLNLVDYVSWWFKKPDAVIGTYSTQAAWATAPSTFRDQFRDVGVPLVSLLAGVIGGVYAEYLANKAARP
ncbi:MAG: hypothetical protein U0836_16985 [Pirellulales bacterium]